MSDIVHRVTQTRGRARATLVRAIESVTRIIDANRRLAEFPGHRASAEQRVAEGEVEKANLERALSELDQADQHTRVGEQPPPAGRTGS